MNMFPTEFLNNFRFDGKPLNGASKQAIFEINPFTPSKVMPMQGSMAWGSACSAPWRRPLHLTLVCRLLFRRSSLEYNF